jgi:phospholipid/cholesterol/gamma-HCH transport system substrate-binding protein
MNKSAPSFAQILTMVVFALSCFGLLLFLWLSFGGPVPLNPKGYQVRVAFPEATTLAKEADVRIAGVTVGKVRDLDLSPDRDRTLATLEIESQFAPIKRDTRTLLRQKTLLGETYVELLPAGGGADVPEGGRLADAQIQDTVQLDEIFDSLDPPTRQAFRTWQQELAKGVEGHGRDFNDALGTLPGFAADGADVLAVLDSQRGALGRLVKNTGVVFGALTENEGQLEALITTSKQTFDATARQNRALSDVIRVFPTFLDESRATFTRLQDFSADTRPLVQDLRPVARDLEPTMRDVHAMAPDLERFFVNLDPVITESRTAMPATREILEGAEPLLASLHPFLGQLNPILQYLEAGQYQVTDFLTFGAAALSDTTVSQDGGVGHYLRQFGPTGAEGAAFYRQRIKTNRGNSYVPPGELFGPNAGLITPSFDCRNTGGDHPPSSSEPGCQTAKRFRINGRLQPTFPVAQAEDYSKAKK